MVPIGLSINYFVLPFRDFSKAIVKNCRCYMKLHDSPLKSSAEENDELSKLPAAQRKKLRQKQKKAEARAKRVTYRTLF